jgi:hypothetical protein
MACGGAGFFLGWLPLATAHHDAVGAEGRATHDKDVRNTFMRRVIPIP